MKLTLRTLALAAALLPSVLAGRGIDKGLDIATNKNTTSTKPVHGDKSGKTKTLGPARWSNAKKANAGIFIAETLTISGDSDASEALVYSKKGASVYVRCTGKDAPNVGGVDCNFSPCAQIYVEVDDPENWFGGCNNGNSQSPDLTDVDGICFFIDSDSGDEVSEWYYGGSIMNKSGRYIYGDALSMMTGQQPFGQNNTCYFGGTFYDLLPKFDLDSAKYQKLAAKRGD
ncbi:hypothetical protein VYU27_008228 [Nannochloropsis oceanica]